MAITKKQLTEEIRNLGISRGALLHVKASMKSIGPIEGGAEMLLEAFLDVIGPEGTILGNGYIDTYPLPLSREDACKISTEKTPSNTGIFNNIMIRHPDMVRSKHPVRRYVAIGKMAHELLDNHTADSYADEVIEKMALKGGISISIGDHLNWGATAHAAQKQAGLKKKSVKQGVNYIDQEGNAKLFKVDYIGGCLKGYPKIFPIFLEKGIVKEGKIGNAVARITRMDETLMTGVEVFRTDPGFFFCDDPTCKDCRIGWEHSTGSWWSVKWHSVIAKLKGVAG